QVQPSSAATAGAAFVPQPVIRVEDAYGNLRSSDNSTVVNAARNAGTSALQGGTNLTATNGVVTFTNLSYNVAETMTIGFTAASLTGVISDNVLVGPGPANRLIMQMQPSATVIAGEVFAQQPVVRIEDQFGNTRSNDNATVVTATRSSGNGLLQGATVITAANGFASFTNLSHNVAT